MADPETLISWQHTAAGITVDDAILGYIIDLSDAIEAEGHASLSVRYRNQLLRLAQASALIDSRDFTLPEDVQAMLYPSLRHRMTRIDPTQRKPLSVPRSPVLPFPEAAMALRIKSPFSGLALRLSHRWSRRRNTSRRPYRCGACLFCRNAMASWWGLRRWVFLPSRFGYRTICAAAFRGAVYRLSALAYLGRAEYRWHQSFTAARAAPDCRTNRPA